MKRLIISTLVAALAVFSLRAQTQLSIDLNQRYQTLDGFGGSAAWFTHWLPAHPNRTELYDLLFKDLGLDILRLRNVYQHADGYAEMGSAGELVRGGQTALGRPLKVLISAWTPPEFLKKDGRANGGTLAKNAQGFRHADYAQHWLDALAAYRAIGVNPDYISLQNEPDYENTGWETCIFWPDASENFPAYGDALNALHARLATLSSAPKLLGPEATGIHPGVVESYLNKLDRAKLGAYGIHLYSGGMPQTPDSYVENLRAIARLTADKPCWMTEFAATESGVTDWFLTAWLMHHALAEGKVSAYLYWDLFWGREHKPAAGLISLENPWNPQSWSTPRGYVIQDNFYAVKHFSRFVEAGYQRVQISSSNPELKASAYVSGDESRVVAVLLNTGSAAQSCTLASGGFNLGGSQVFQSTTGAFDRNLGALPSTLALPARSVTTVVLQRGAEIPSPVARLTVTPASGVVPLSVTCDGRGSSDPQGRALSYAWSFSDGGSATGPVVSHVFAAAGTHRVVLTISNGSRSATAEASVEAVRVTGCNYTVPAAQPLPSINRQYNFVHRKGAGSAVLSNAVNLTVNWDLPNKGLWQFSILTNNGVPGWWMDLRASAVVRFDRPAPEITLTGTGFSGFDGAYYVALDGENLVLVSKTQGATLYFSTSATPPPCF